MNPLFIQNNLVSCEKEDVRGEIDILRVIGYMRVEIEQEIRK